MDEETRWMANWQCNRNTPASAEKKTCWNKGDSTEKKAKKYPNQDSRDFFSSDTMLNMRKGRRTWISHHNTRFMWKALGTRYEKTMVKDQPPRLTQLENH